MPQLDLFEASVSRILSVTQLNQYLRALMESDEILKDVWVQGEISNLSLPASGHAYLTLKDQDSALRCVIWKNAASGMRRFLLEGAAIEAHGYVSVYERGGQYQLYIDLIQPAGEGALYQEFVRLKTMLENEGLFSQERKRPIPYFPKLIGIVTSPSGAALQDILNILRTRFPLVEAVIAPTAVQGMEAPGQIVQAIRSLNQKVKPDVILVARGGGSLEDLWAFNDEMVVRAIVASQAPVITGIGHETDFTLADFAADLRAPTPTAAAMAAVPDIQELKMELPNKSEYLHTLLRDRLEERRMNLGILARRLQQLSPQAKLRQEMQRMDEINIQICRSINHIIQVEKMKLAHLNNHLYTLDPHQVLKRGYAIISDELGATIHTIRKVRPTQQVRVQLQDGRFHAEVEKTEPEGKIK